MYSFLKLGKFKRESYDIASHNFQFIVEDAQKDTQPSDAQITSWRDPWNGYSSNAMRYRLASKDIYFKIGESHIVMNLLEFYSLIERMRIAVSNSLPDYTGSAETNRVSLRDEYVEWLLSNQNLISSSEISLVGMGVYASADTPF